MDSTTSSLRNASDVMSEILFKRHDFTSHATPYSRCRSGARIRDLMAQTHTHIWIDQQVLDDEDRVIYIFGNQENIAKVKASLESIILKVSLTSPLWALTTFLT